MDFVLSPIFPFLISTLDTAFSTCHTSMKLNGVNLAYLTGAKMDSNLYRTPNKCVILKPVVPLVAVQ